MELDYEEGDGEEVSKASRQAARDKAVDQVRSGLFKRGVLTHRDSQRGDNEGLGPREIKALAEENSRPWGLNIGKDYIARRGRDAGHR